MSGPPYSFAGVSQSSLQTARLTALDANHIHAWELTEASGATQFADTGSSATLVPLVMLAAANIQLGNPGLLGACPLFGVTSAGAHVATQAAALISAFNDDATNKLPGTNFSLEVWAAQLSLPGSQATLISGDFNASINCQVGINSTNQVVQVTNTLTGGFNNVTSDATSFNPNVLSVWHHHMLTYDGAHAISYLDGVLVKSTATAGAMQWTHTTGTAPSLILGAQGTTATVPFYGYLSRFRISNIVRTQAYAWGVYSKALLQ